MPPYFHHPKVAADTLLCGGVVAYPTEGVYGLGCDPFNADAVSRILTIKGRSVDKGLILIADRLEKLLPFLNPISDENQRKLVSSWPGPTTWVIPHNGRLPGWVTGFRDRVAVRVTSHPVARSLCQYSPLPIVSTSANRSGKPALISSFQVRQQLGEEVDYLLTGKVQTPGQSSQIIDLESGQQLRI